MADINNVTFTGRLTRDAENKTLSSGVNLVAFDIANNTGFGQYAKTIYFTVNLWGKSGINIFPYLKKGQQVGVTGTLEVQTWQDTTDGGKRQKNVINSNSVILLGRAKENDTPVEPDPRYEGGIPF
jgi:single-strand DNA-binding protein